jgi:hypothetical protein
MAKGKEVGPVLTLGELTLSHFVPLLGSTFSCSVKGTADVELMLISATSLAGDDGGNGPPREPFSLIFVSSRDVSLPQSIYSLQHFELGALDIFLVPIGCDAAGRRYEAVFS